MRARVFQHPPPTSTSYFSRNVVGRMVEMVYFLLRLEICWKSARTIVRTVVLTPIDCATLYFTHIIGCTNFPLCSILQRTYRSLQLKLFQDSWNVYGQKQTYMRLLNPVRDLCNFLSETLNGTGNSGIGRP